MQLFEKLDSKNFLLYAAKHYYKPKVIDAEEFYDDLKRFMYLKRLLKRHYKTGELSERLVLNHLIVVFNVFDIEPCLKMLEYQIDSKYWPALKPFLIFLRHIRNDQYTDIEMDKVVIEKLRKI
jgi:hypothetical protein